MSDVKPVVIVTWVDTVSVGSWTPAAEFEEQEPHVCQSVGWLVAQDSHKVHLWTTQADGEVSGTIIPMGCVLSIVAVDPGT